MCKILRLLLLIFLVVLCIVFPILFLILLLYGHGFKKCDVCKKWRFWFTDKNYRDGYNACYKFLSLGARKKSSGFVCEFCYSEIESKVECERCHRHNFISYSSDGPLDGPVHETAQTIRLLRQLQEICPDLSFPDYKILCDDCRRYFHKEVLNKATQNLLTSISTGKVEPILIHNGKSLAPKHCARCGKYVSDEDNKIKQLKFLYEDYPYSDSKSECCSVIAEYLKADTICSSCCWQLRPEHVRKDFLFRSGDGWIGGVKADSIPGYKVMHSFDVVSYFDEDCRSIDEVKRKLREKSLLVGANGFVNFWYNRLSKTCYTGRAVPVTFDKLGAVNSQQGHSLGAGLEQSGSCMPKARKLDVSLPAKLIIDGSNLLRARGTYSVAGLFACLFALKKSGCHAQVFFDANILHVLDEDGDISGRERLEKLMKDYPDRAQMVPAGSRADDFILLRANGDGSHILSNDRFEQYVDRYPWLKEQRLHKFMFMDGRLLIPDFGIDVEVT